MTHIAWKDFKINQSGLVWGQGDGAPGRRRIFENLQINSCKKLQKCCIFVYLAKFLGKFSRVWTKNTIVWEIWRKLWKSLMQIHWTNWSFIYFLGKYVDKNRKFGNNTIFLQHFFGSGGGRTPTLTPCLRDWLYRSKFKLA